MNIDLGKIRFDFQGDYSASIEYELNDVVKHGGNIYVYIHPLKSSGNPPSNTTYWTLLIEGLKFRGVYSGGTTYYAGETAVYNSITYIALVTTTGNLPTDTAFWGAFSPSQMDVTPTVVKTNGQTLELFKLNKITSAGSFTLPAMTDGQWLEVINLFGTVGVFILRGGNKFNGIADDLELATANRIIRIKCIDATSGVSLT